MKTTLNKIRDHTPCVDGWEKLLNHLGKTKGDDEPLDLITILDSNGLDNCLWCFRAVDGHEKEIRLFNVWCVRQVQHLMTDQRSIDALDVAERFANGQATRMEFDAAAKAAARAAAEAAEAAAGQAWTAARAAARTAAAVAAGEATAWAAAGEAAWAAARAAGQAWIAAEAAAQAKQENYLREILL